jgi:Fur family ferric uptake transcriptional regulator
MVHPPHGPWHAVLRERGHRLTPQRELVLAAVDRLGHGTPEEIHEEVVSRAPAVNISTVYRNLALLEELGVVRVVNLNDRTSTYHSVALPAHVHLTCTGCGRVTDADPSEFRALAEALASRHGFTVDLDRLVMAGRCAACLGD